MKRSPLGLHFELPSAAQEITLGSNQACVLIQMRLRQLGCGSGEIYGLWIENTYAALAE
jgi:hypothetical protein